MHNSFDLTNKKILLGITGGIAAYKAAELARLLIKRGAEVRVVMTRAAQEFVQPLTFATLSHQQVYTDMFEQNLKVDLAHISLARWADAILIAPATANCIAKLAHGIADDLLSTTCLATTAPICLAPAMNGVMWQNAATQHNIATLVSRQVKVFGPEVGVQACGEVSAGRMLEPPEILTALENVFLPPLFKGKHIIITAGPTYEPIDAMRFIGNRSSGKMGYAIAKAARDFGASVTLISGATSLSAPSGVEHIAVTTAEQMLDVVMQRLQALPSCDIFISTAAVSDYRPRQPARGKIKRDVVGKAWQLNLTQTSDILRTVAALPRHPLTIGFAAETENLLANARAKLQSKGLDAIAANLIGEGDNSGFGVDTNELTLLTKDGKEISLPKQDKQALAYDLLREIAAL